MFTPEARELQERFDTQRLADRIAEHFVTSELTPEQMDYIRGARMFFIATVTGDGQPECSYKGGRPGFVQVVDERTLILPFYDGNGLFSTLGNLRATGRVGLLFVDFEESYRLRVNGTASVDDRAESPGALLNVRVSTETVYELCERYVHRMAFVEESPYCPAAGYEPPPAPYLSKPLYDGARPGEAAS